jgi:hypothetical protein
MGGVILTPIKVLVGGAVLLSGSVVLAIQQIPTPAVPIKVEMPEERFDLAWSDVMVPMALKKADMDRVRTIPLAKPVVTERVVPDPVATPPVEEALDAPAPRHRRRQVKTERTERRDVCARHGQRKVMVGKYRWKCRK